MRFVLLACLASVSVGTELDDLYAEFNSASQEIITQLHGTSEYYSADTVPVQKLAQTVDPWHPDHQGSEDKNTKAARDATEELAEEDDDTPYTQMLLDEKTHKAAVKASYQTNVKTIYFHLEEIIKKILAHKTKWTNKYNGDLAKIAKEVLKHKNIAKGKEKKYMAAKGKAEAAKALAKTKNKSWQKAKNKLKQKIKDAKKQKKALKGLYLKGLKQKAGEICMIRKIECMVAKFNGEATLQAKYCGACKEMAAFTKVSGGSSGGVYVTTTLAFPSKKMKKFVYKNICPKAAARAKGMYRCKTANKLSCNEYIEFRDEAQFAAYKAWGMKSVKEDEDVKTFLKSGGTFTPWKRLSAAEFNKGLAGDCDKV